MILVTGANGLLGSQVCGSLVKNGEKVVALVRKSSNLELLDDIKEEIEIIYGNVLSPEEFSEDLENINCIIHCAAVVSFHQKDKAIMDKINIQGTANMVNLALKLNIDYFIHISSVAALGRLSGSGEVSEKNTWVESKLNSNYAQSKYYSELEVWRGIEEGLNAVILNPSVILSSQNIGRSSGQLFQYAKDERSYYPAGSINYVDIRDIIKVINQCLTSKIRGERYILNGGIITYKEFFERISSRLNVKAPSKKASKGLLKLAMFLEFLKSILTGKRALITKETVLLSDSEIYFSNKKVKEELNFNFASLNNTLDWACSSSK